LEDLLLGWLILLKESCFPFNETSECVFMIHPELFFFRSASASGSLRLPAEFAPRQGKARFFLLDNSSRSCIASSPDRLIDRLIGLRRRSAFEKSGISKRRGGVVLRFLREQLSLVRAFLAISIWISSRKPSPVIERIYFIWKSLLN